MKLEPYHEGEMGGAKEVGARRTHNMKTGREEGEKQRGEEQ